MGAGLLPGSTGSSWEKMRRIERSGQDSSIRHRSKDVDKAISILKELVDGKKHDMVACALMLGDIYSEGVYTAPDAALAKSYYQIAIDNAKEGSDEAEKAASALKALGWRIVKLSATSPDRPRWPS